MEKLHAQSMGSPLPPPHSLIFEKNLNNLQLFQTWLQSLKLIDSHRDWRDSPTEELKKGVSLDLTNLQLAPDCHRASSFLQLSHVPEQVRLSRHGVTTTEAKDFITCLRSYNLYFTLPQQAELHTQPTPYKPTINPGSTEHPNQVSPDRPTSHTLFLVRRRPRSLAKGRSEHRVE